jgi:hypothetical protein
MDGQLLLRDALEAAVGEPPRRISAESVRRRATRRRGAQAIIVAAAVFAAGAGFAVASTGPAASGRQSKLPPAGATPGPVPRYYVAVAYQGDLQVAVVRSTATGRVTARAMCPDQGQIYDVAEAGDQTLFALCERTVQESGGGQYHVGPWIYRFQITSSGQVRDVGLVPGGSTLTGDSVGWLTAAADGNYVAVVATPNGAPSRNLWVSVINTRTGKQARWQDDLGNPMAVTISDLSLSADGSELAFFYGNPDNIETTVTADSALRVLSPAPRGGELSDSHVIASGATLADGLVRGLDFAAVSPDGSSVTAIMAEGPSFAWPTSIWAVRLSATTGRQLRLLYRASIANGLLYFGAGSDPTGRFLLLNLGPESTPGQSTPPMRKGVFGWLDDGRVVRIPPAGLNPGYAVW